MRLRTKEAQADSTVKMISGSWSVRKSEKAVSAILAGGVSEAVSIKKSPWIEKLENDFSGVVGSPVEIDEAGGCLRIDYRMINDVLDGILTLLGHHSGA